MKADVYIEIEQYDNGYSLKWHDITGYADDCNIVLPKEKTEWMLGSVILKDIKSVMDGNAANQIKIEILYEPLIDKQNEKK